MADRSLVFLLQPRDLVFKVTDMPHTLEMYSTETLPLGIDVSARLEGDTPPTSLSSSLIRMDTGEAAAESLSGSPSAVGNTIFQTVTGLEAGVTYCLYLTFTAAVGKVFTEPLIIVCLA